MRLNKLISKHQNCTRKEADDLIKNGLVTVNGRVAFKMGIT
ncbi:MAG: pseudouridine synthase, partial [Candidatus Marinimicrobia bacterium]|nr:pseudouridine synthase [Candidatus Neomarinimicrobiota bacterium]